jgi:hypothetical protein
VSEPLLGVFVDVNSLMSSSFLVLEAILTAALKSQAQENLIFAAILQQ